MSNAKILIVEDEPSLIETLDYSLRRQGYEVVTANDGRKALVSARQQQPDLIVLDVMLPGLDGFEAYLPHPSPGNERAHHHAHRADGGGRQGGRAGSRRRRLPDQTVQHARVDRVCQGEPARRRIDREEATNTAGTLNLVTERMVFGDLVIDLSRRESPHRGVFTT